MGRVEDQNHKFIATEPLGKGGRGEKQVWDAMREAFAARECVGYWRYPIFSQVGKFRKEPDILIVERKLGLIVIEVKSVTIDQIVAIIGHRWEYQNFYTTSGNPYQQAENQLFALLGYCDHEPILYHKVTARALVALPLISAEQWQERGFDQLPTCPPILFQNQLPGNGKGGKEDSSNELLQQIQQTLPVVTGSQLTAEQWTLLLSVLAGTPLFRPSSHRVLSPSKSRGSVLLQLRKHISTLDWQQECIGKQIPPGSQRIRGIAGSGKTVLLCQKAAHMHLKHPDWKIALVFFSRSLYYSILEELDKWLRRFSNNEQEYNPKNPQLRVLHAWGAKKQPGLYSTLCQATGIQPLTVNDTKNKQPNKALAEACIYLLQEAIPQRFDAILIDEGQDLIVDDALKFEDKQPFYWLAYQALRPVHPTRPEQSW